MRVLVVDDEEAARYLIATLLKAHHYEVDEAVDGRDALEKARMSPPDIIVTDILMPNMDGYQLCREWKADPVLSTRPLVFYSATYTEPADERFAISLGADAFFVKPQEPDVLVRLIEEVLERHEQSGIAARTADSRTEEEVLREYSERLVAKLEIKIVELNKANADLRSAMEVLSDEVDVKSGLIEQLTKDLRVEQEASGTLRAVNELLTAVVEECPLPIISIDRDMVVTMANPAACAALGTSCDELMGSVFPVSEDGRRRQDEIVASDAAMDVERAEFEDGSGRVRAYRGVMGPVHGEDGSVTGFYAILHPIDG